MGDQETNRMEDNLEAADAVDIVDPTQEGRGKDGSKLAQMLAISAVAAMATVGCPTEETNVLSQRNGAAEVVNDDVDTPAYGQVAVSFVNNFVVVSGYTKLGGFIQIKVLSGEEEVFNLMTPVPQDSEGGYSLETAAATDLANEDGRLKGPVVVVVSDLSTGASVRVPLF